MLYTKQTTVHCGQEIVPEMISAVFFHHLSKTNCAPDIAVDPTEAYLDDIMVRLKDKQMQPPGKYSVGIF